jgi:cytochrome b subunit of formate dehydrogenase
MAHDEKLHPVLRANALAFGLVLHALPTGIKMLGPVGKIFGAATEGKLREMANKSIHEGWTGEMTSEERERYRRIMAGDESACDY